MRVRALTWSAALAALLVAAPVDAQEAGVVTAPELDAALADRAAAVDAERAVVRRTLERPEVARVATAMGMDLDAARAAAGALAGEDLARAADLSRSVEQALAGGQVFSINATTLIIVLLLVILIVIIAD